MTGDPDAADPSSLAPADWGIARKSAGTSIGARVPVLVAERWTQAVADIAKTYGITKGNAVACGILVALGRMDEWHSLAQDVGGRDNDEADPPSAKES